MLSTAIIHISHATGLLVLLKSSVWFHVVN